MPPLVSATVFCYNHEQYIEECLDGVLAQDYPDLELIIIDDCSTDRSAEVIEAWLSRRGVKADFVRHERNLGTAASVNDGYSRARGKYIAPCSSDDVWLPGKLRRHVEIMESLDDSWGLLYSDALMMSEDGRLWPGRFIEHHRPGFRPPSGRVRRQLIDANWIPGMTMLVRREAHERALPYPEDMLYEDWLQMIRYAGRFKLYYDPEPSAKYRVSRASQTATVIAPRDARVLLDEVRLFRRVLNEESPDAEERARLRERIAEVAHEFWLRGDWANARAAARDALRYGPARWPLAVYTLSALRVPRRALSGLRRALGYSPLL